MSWASLKRLVVWHPLGVAAVFGLVTALLMIATVLITGQTFGQRCAKAYPANTPTWEACVIRLSHGGEL